MAANGLLILDLSRSQLVSPFFGQTTPTITYVAVGRAEAATELRRPLARRS
jgi:hypothetical protein